jgi:hypothetical protein
MVIESLGADINAGAIPACRPGIRIPGNVNIVTQAVTATARTT